MKQETGDTSRLKIESSRLLLRRSDSVKFQRVKTSGVEGKNAMMIP